MKLQNFASVTAIGLFLVLAACSKNNASQLPGPDVLSSVEKPNPSPQLDNDLRGLAETRKLHQGEIESALAQLQPDSTLLAHKLISLPELEDPLHVIVLRGLVPNTPFVYSQNPCVLMVLREAQGTYIPVASNDRTVDCTHINFFRDIAVSSDDLNDNLVLDEISGQISFVNEYTRSTSLYSFKYWPEEDSWFLSGIRNNYPMQSTSGDEMLSVTEAIQYPEDFGRISMDDFDPAELVDELTKSRVVN